MVTHEEHIAEREAKNKRHLDQYKDWVEAKEASMRHWRAWGSWFSWGSPVGLGLFFIELAAATWIITQAF